MQAFIICTVHQLIKAIKLREKNIIGHIACIQQMRNAHKILFRKLTRERQQLKDITLITENNMRVWSGFS